MRFVWDVVRPRVSVSCCDSLLMIHVPRVPLPSVKFQLKGTVFWFTLVQHTYLSTHTTVVTYIQVGFLLYKRKIDHSDGAEAISDGGNLCESKHDADSFKSPFHNPCHPACAHDQAAVTNNGALQTNRFRGPEVTVPSIHDVSA